jgi:DNA-binding transcriptional ArsR family regulator
VNNKANLIIHPVRLRIITAFGGRQHTPRQLAALLPDIAQASLYRHISILLKAGILEVVAEQQVNGSIERTLAIAKGQINLTASDLQALPREDHLRYFSIFSATLIESFAEYMRTATLSNIIEDGLSYNVTTIHLSDEERAQLSDEIDQVIQRVWANPPTPERKSYTLASIVIPHTDATDSTAQEHRSAASAAQSSRLDGSTKKGNNT